jgi:hypothetical protein
MIPGTSCLATIGLSLRGENHFTIEAPRIGSRLWGFNPWERNTRGDAP